jgi:hypothetical protein
MSQRLILLLTMLSACPLQLHGAIYNRSQALGSWRSTDIVTT